MCFIVFTFWRKGSISYTLSDVLSVLQFVGYSVEASRLLGCRIIEAIQYKDSYVIEIAPLEHLRGNSRLLDA